MSTPEKSDKPRFVPAAGRRNFKLSGLELLIVGLIVLGVVYLITMWASSAFTPEPEAAAPSSTASGILMEKALAASEKAQAQLSSLGKDLGALRKDMDELRARRSSSGSGHPAPAHSDALERRVEDMEKQVKALAVSKEDKALAALAQDFKALNARLERLEKAAKAQEKQASASAPPVAADPNLLARMERLEQASAQAKPQPKFNLDDIEHRLDKLEKELNQATRGQAKAAAPAPERETKPTAAAQEPKPEVKAPPTKLASRPSAPRPQPEHRKINHKVRPGETILGLARKYKVSHDDIVRWNAGQLGDRRQLLIGETIVIIPGSNS